VAGGIPGEGDAMSDASAQLPDVLVHDVERVLNRHFDTELTLRLEGEAQLAKGVGR